MFCSVQKPQVRSGDYFDAPFKDIKLEGNGCRQVFFEKKLKFKISGIIQISLVF